MTSKSQLLTLGTSPTDLKLLSPNSFVEFYGQGVDELKLSTFGWIDRKGSSESGSLNCTFFEGSTKGKLWIRHIYQDHDKMLRIPTEFTDKVKLIKYNSDKNIVFVTSGDGRLLCFKLPSRWGGRDMVELDTQISSKIKTFFKVASRMST